MSDFDNMFAKFGFAKKDKKQSKAEGLKSQRKIWVNDEFQFRWSKNRCPLFMLEPSRPKPFI